MATKLWAGLDIGVEKTSICVINDAGEIVRTAVCPTNLNSVHRELAFLKRRRFARVGLEAGCGISLARGLRNLGYTVDIYEARQLSKFLAVRRNKTDAGDANGIAEAGRLGTTIVSKIHMKSLDCQCLSARLAIRRHLIRVRVRVTNLLCRLLEQFGGRVVPCRNSKLLRVEVEAEIRRLFGRTPNPIVLDLRALLDRCAEMMDFLKLLDRDLSEAAQKDAVCKRLMTIPGVGPICALTFTACVEEPHRFRRSEDIGPYLGLTPRLFESGLTQRTGRISKFGSKPTRALLVQASTVFMRCGDPTDELYAWASRIEGRRGKGKSRIALARKLAMIMIAIWKSGASYQQKTVNSGA